MSAQWTLSEAKWAGLVIVVAGAGVLVPHPPTVCLFN